MTSRKIALAPPCPLAGALAGAVAAGGGEPVDDPSEAAGLVWCHHRPGHLGDLLAASQGLSWVQVPYAGIEEFRGLLDDSRAWSCAKGIYGPVVAEFGLGLILAGLRHLDRYARMRRWEPLSQRTLAGSRVLMLGAGGIGASLGRMLVALEAEVRFVSRSGGRVDALESRPLSALFEEVAAADVVVLALPLTAETTGLVDGRFLAAMKRGAWLVNLARGRVVVTDELVTALEAGRIGGAALDVTDPEPLPPEHRLFELDNALITPHVANTPEIGTAALGRLVTENTRRFLAGEPLLGLVDPGLGY